MSTRSRAYPWWGVRGVEPAVLEKELKAAAVAALEADGGPLTSEDRIEFEARWWATLRPVFMGVLDLA